MNILKLPALSDSWASLADDHKLVDEWLGGWVEGGLVEGGWVNG